MANHPKRGRIGPTITAEQVFGARINAKQTQTEAATTIYRTLRGWQDWEAGVRPPDAAVFELYLIKTGQIDRWRSVYPTEYKPNA